MSIIEKAVEKLEKGTPSLAEQGLALPEAVIRDEIIAEAVEQWLERKGNAGLPNTTLTVKQRQAKEASGEASVKRTTQG